MNHQEAFEKAFLSLYAQGVKSMNAKKGGMCMYRGEENRKCALGHLIPDDRYLESMEDTVPREHNRDDKGSRETRILVEACGFEVTPDNVAFLKGLQTSSMILLTVLGSLKHSSLGSLHRLACLLSSGVLLCPRDSNDWSD